MYENFVRHSMRLISNCMHQLLRPRYNTAKYLYEITCTCISTSQSSVNHVNNLVQICRDLVEGHTQLVSDILQADMQIYKTLCTRVTKSLITQRRCVHWVPYIYRNNFVANGTCYNRTF